jgi:hypothetical protein
MYLKITNGTPEKYSLGMLRRDNPNTSFPKNPTDALLAEWGVYPYTVPERPSYDSLLQNCVEGSFAEVNGAWLLPWVVENKPQEEAEAIVRGKRNSLLQDSDWTQVADAPVDQAAWAAYRTLLRDITSQAGFPYSVTWPTQPE